MDIFSHLGSVPDIDEIFPPRPIPVKRGPPDDSVLKGGPSVTGAGFFTPDAGGGGNLFRTWNVAQPQPFRIQPPPTAAGPRDSMYETLCSEDAWCINCFLILSATNDSSFYPDNSFVTHRPVRSQPPPPPLPPANSGIPRPLSSADESGPVPKRLRATSRQPELKTKASKALFDDPLKKARARPALSFANIFSSSVGRSQSTTVSRTTSGHGKSNAPPVPNAGPTRRSTRLLSNNGQKPPSKVCKFVFRFGALAPSKLMKL